MNEETAALLRRCDDLMGRCEKSGSVTHTSFLTPAEQYALRSLRLTDGVKLLFRGGGEGSERCCAFFLPWYMEEEDFQVGDHISCVCLQSYFGTPGHRDYMGAALGLGIRREWLGDIRVEGDRAWVFCLPTVTQTLCELDKVGRVSVKGREIALSEVPAQEIRTKEVRFTVKSLRLDAVCGEMFALSRTAAAEQIRLGLVSLNYSVCEKVDAAVKEGDVISLRGKGKGTLTEVGGRSKKDRLFLTAEIRL